MRSLLVALASVSLVAAPIAAASAQSAAPLSLTGERAGAGMQGAQGIEGEDAWIYYGLGAVALIIFLILILDDDDEDDDGISP